MLIGSHVHFVIVKSKCSYMALYEYGYNKYRYIYITPQNSNYNNQAHASTYTYTYIHVLEIIINFVADHQSVIVKKKKHEISSEFFFISFPFHLIFYDFLDFSLRVAMQE